MWGKAAFNPFTLTSSCKFSTCSMLSFQSLSLHWFFSFHCVCFCQLIHHSIIPLNIQPYCLHSLSILIVMILHASILACLINLFFLDISFPWVCCFSFNFHSEKSSKYQYNPYSTEFRLLSAMISSNVVAIKFWLYSGVMVTKMIATHVGFAAVATI